MHDSGALTMRMATAAMLAVFLAVGLVGTLNYLRFETNLTDLVTSRLDVLLDDISAPAQLAVDLDLDLPAATDLHTALQRRAAADPLILGIRIVDSTGSIVFAVPERSSGGDAGPSVPAIGLDRDLVNALGDVVGRVELSYSPAELNATLRAVGLRLAVASAGIGLVAGLALAAVTTVWLRRALRPYRALAARLPVIGPEENSGAEADRAATLRLDEAAAVAAGAGEAADDFGRLARAARTGLADLTDAVRQVDRLTQRPPGHG